MSDTTVTEVPPSAARNVVIDVEAAQEGLIMTMVQMAEMSTGEMTLEVCDDMERLYRQVATDLARVRVGLSQT